MITFGDPGINPRTSRMQSERSTIWGTSHSLELSRKLLFQSANKRLLISLSQQLWSFSFRSQKIYLLGVSICNRLSADSDYLYHYLQSFADSFAPLSLSADFLWSFSFRSQKIYLLGLSICNRLSADSDYLLEIRDINPRIRGINLLVRSFNMQ